MRLSVLHEQGSWFAVAGHPGKMGNVKGTKVKLGARGKKRPSFLTHPEDRDKFFREDDDITSVGSSSYANSTIKNVRQGGTSSSGEAKPAAGSDIDDVGSSKYVKDTYKPSRKWVGPAKKLKTLSV